MATTQLQTFEDNPLTFGIGLSEADNRLDCDWFNPVIKNEVENLRNGGRYDRKLVKLKSLAEVRGGKRLPKGTVILETGANIIPYVRATDVRGFKVNLDSAIRIPKEIHREIQNYQLLRGDVVVTIVGTIGRSGILEEDVGVCNFTENVARVRVNKGSVLERFVLYFLNSEFAQRQMRRLSAGSLQLKLSLSRCRDIEVYIPYKMGRYDIEAQQQILDEVESLFEKARQREKKAKELIERANSVVVKNIDIFLPDEGAGIIFTRPLGSEQSGRLDALFNNPVRGKLIADLKKYPHKQLGELIVPQRGGTVVVPSDFYKLVELEDIDEKTGRIVSSREVSRLGSKKVLLKADGILISKLQPEKGKIVITPREYEGTAGSSELVPLSLESAEVSLKYLWAALRSQYVLKQWEYTLTGSSRMRIGATELKQTIIPIPDKKTQNEITANIEGLISQSDKLLRKAAKLSKEAEELFISAVIG